MEVEVKSAQEAFQVFWKGRVEGIYRVLESMRMERKVCKDDFDVTDLALLASGSVLARK